MKIKFGYGISFLKTISILLVACFAYSCTEQAEVKKVPIIYSSDLFNPPNDPDDHYDLATLFLMPEFEIKAVIFDLAIRQAEGVGVVPLEQISAITGRPIPPYAIGLRHRLAAPDDQAKEQAPEFQGGVDLILKILRESNEKVALFLVGSCRDFAVAYNREPELLRKKVSAVYVSAGNGPDGKQDECNVSYDPNAYLCLLKSDLPVYWLPCITRKGYVLASKADIEKKNDMSYNSCFSIYNQAELLKNTPTRLRNYFYYAISLAAPDFNHNYENRAKEDKAPILFEDHIAYLDRTPPGEIPTTKRSMYSTAAFFHAAGRKIYAGQDGGYFAYSPQEAKKLGIKDKEVKVYSFVPVHVSQEASDNPRNLILKTDLNVKKSPTQIFQYIHPEYNDIMLSALSNLLEMKEN
jgi:hypothetical protein